MKLVGKMALVALLATLAGCQSGGSSASVDPELDHCEASKYQKYIGQPLSVIDAMNFAHPVRSIPYNASVTMDFNLNRINFSADSKGNISQVYCG